MPKEGGTNVVLLEKYSCIMCKPLGSVYVLCKYSCHIEYTKAVTLHCGKSGRWYGPKSCNTPPVVFVLFFFFCHNTASETLDPVRLSHIWDARACAKCSCRIYALSHACRAKLTDYTFPLTSLFRKARKGQC